MNKNLTEISNISTPNNFPSSLSDNAQIQTFDSLEAELNSASKLVDDIILKKYLYNLSEFEIIPLDEHLKKISSIRLFKINEMVYQGNEYSTYKFASVFNSVQNLNCGVFIIADSNGKKTDFYMGVRSLDDKRTIKSLKDTLRNALIGQFPGVKTKDLLNSEAEDFLSDLSSKNIASVSCVAQNKDDDFKNNEAFIQGLEKFTLAMQGQKYTIIILAKNAPCNQLSEVRKSYETIYTQLSPFANMQLSYGRNEAISISNSFSHGTSFGTSYTKNRSSNHGGGVSKSEGEAQADVKQAILKAAGNLALGAASLITAPLTGGASIAAAAAIQVAQVGWNAIPIKTKNKGTAENENWGTAEGEAWGENKNEQYNEGNNIGNTEGTSENIQLTKQNKTIIDTLKKIDLQLQRIDECESIGMWECAAYILSDTQETVEMAAGTYKALMKGANSGVETSSINFWGRKSADKLPILRDYITNFIHPIFKYKIDSEYAPVTAASLVSSNELAIHMGLPRKSVCGLPVVEHAEFAKEVTRYVTAFNSQNFAIGNIYSMGTETESKVRLDRDSLTMHTFISGSTGSGKSNTIYQILSQLRNTYNIPFLVIEPAKGEYKDVLGKFNDVTVYGTNPKKCRLLKINPFRFPNDTHILEHLDRLVEIFNVCWPMYAAMPAILKDSVERAYIAAGWDLISSENKYDNNLFPTFTDVLSQIKIVLNESDYSADNKGDYTGALVTRIRSLTTGINGLIFSSDDISDEDLFDNSVIVDLSRVGSTETKSLIMGLLVLKLQEHRMESGKINSALNHVTVLEEAHNLLKRTSTEQSSENSNLLGKSVELLANSIAEMRTYGEGFIIADQSPGLLDMSAIRNTNTKIIMRLPDFSDRELVGKASGLNDNQIIELGKLEKGVASIIQNDWIEPVLCKIFKYESLNHTNIANRFIAEKIYDNSCENELLQCIMNKEIYRKYDSLCIRNIGEHIASSQLSATVKCDFYEYIFSEKNDEKKKLRKLVYDFFNADKAIQAAKKGCKDIYQWSERISENLTPSVKNYGKEMIKPILALIIREQAERDTSYNKIYIEYTRLYKYCGGVV